ncbi:hypothetical protein EDC04DRAFT_2602355 [Pisolithus marmoratus]|nr:hypothetical protein EDC04DRAFT_2602355 [Pisolithus marmoratus]
MSWTSLRSLPIDIFRVPPVEERLPFNKYSFLAYILPAYLSYHVMALLVILPRTRLLRIALWPLITLLAFRAAVYIDFSGGDPKRTFVNVNFALIVFCFAVRVLEWTVRKDPLKRHIRPAGSSPSIVMDVLDLSTNMRGFGWNLSKSFRFPPENRPTSRLWFIAYVFISFWFSRFICGLSQLALLAFSPETFTALSGDTIFDPTLPPLMRYIRSSALTIIDACGIYAVMQMNYDIVTFFGVAVFQQDPAQWPPAYDKPWKSDSLRDFWGYRWHQFLRRTFIVAGGWPLGSLFGHAGYVLGTFLGSGIVHNVVVVMNNQSVEWWCMILSFGMMGVGVVLEQGFTLLTGKQVGGWIGRVWTMTWLLVWGNMIVDGFARSGMFGSANVFEVAVPAKGIVDHYVTAFDTWLRT